MRKAFFDVLGYLDEAYHADALPRGSPRLAGGFAMEQIFAGPATGWDELAIAVHGRDLPATAQEIVQLIFALVVMGIQLGLDLPALWDALLCHYTQLLGGGRNKMLPRLAATDCPFVPALLEAQAPLATIYDREAEARDLDALIAKLHNNANFADTFGHVEVGAALLREAADALDRWRHRQRRSPWAAALEDNDGAFFSGKRGVGL
jgi:hypothetical protein